MKQSRIIAVALALCALSAAAAPDALALELSTMFTSHAVLQCDMDVPVWGWAEPGTEVTVQFAGQTVRAKTDDNGEWSLKLAPLKSNKKPQKMTVSAGDEKTTLEDILVGEVWFSSGQSNMAQTMERFSGCPYGGCLVPEAVNPNELGAIRMLRMGRSADKEPTKRTKAQQPWIACCKEDFKRFSGTAFYFAYFLNKELDVPVGLVGCYVGGTRIEPWIAREGYDALRQYDPNWQPEGYSDMFNGMIASAAPYAIRGAIWYQAEANVEEGDIYFWKIKALHDGWQKYWNQGPFPLYYAQLASFKKPNPDPSGDVDWPILRESQRKALQLPNTGMAVLTDVGDPRNIHPRNKYAVGQRLALWALAKNYGKKDLAYSGPLFRSAEFKDGRATIMFDYGKGLKAAKLRGPNSINDPNPVDELKGFAIAGKDKKWYWADAEIVDDRVVLSSSDVPKPVAARCLYSDNTDHGTLYNEANLPASLFRTDEW